MDSGHWTAPFPLQFVRWSNWICLYSLIVSQDLYRSPPSTVKLEISASRQVINCDRKLIRNRYILLWINKWIFYFSFFTALWTERETIRGWIKDTQNTTKRFTSRRCCLLVPLQIDHMCVCYSTASLWGEGICTVLLHFDGPTEWRGGLVNWIHLVTHHRPQASANTRRGEAWMR